MNAAQRIDEKIASLGDWRGKALADIRRIVHEAVPDVVEEWKWMGTPTWSQNGILCIANAHKEMVQVVFAKGASLPDKDRLFNAMLDGGTWRAVKFFEGDKINEGALRNLVRAAHAFNLAKPTGTPVRRSRLSSSLSGVASAKPEALAKVDGEAGKSAGGKKGPSKPRSKKIRRKPAR